MAKKSFILTNTSPPLNNFAKKVEIDPAITEELERDFLNAQEWSPFFGDTRLREGMCWHGYKSLENSHGQAICIGNLSGLLFADRTGTGTWTYYKILRKNDGI